ncbi:16S rRNA (guanine(527)-N(7))-methyltransferase RsmG [Nocardioides korecus]
MTDVPRETPPAPDSARGVFGSTLPRAEAYADLLATQATLRGLIGPREVPRLWERHLLNCAVVTDLVPQGSTVADIGSGAGLPGLVMAIRRPDLEITLVEPLLRRTTFLEEAVEQLRLENVVVHRGRAEELGPDAAYDVVTSRAVAPMDRLARWSLPLVRPGGLFLAMKGSSVEDELREARKVVERLGGADTSVHRLGEDLLEHPVTVVRIKRVNVRRARV